MSRFRPPNVKHVLVVERYRSGVVVGQLQRNDIDIGKWFGMGVLLSAVNPKNLLLAIASPWEQWGLEGPRTTVTAPTRDDSGRRVESESQDREPLRRHRRCGS